MKCKISNTSYVLNFMDTEESTRRIIQLLEAKYNEILNSNQYGTLEDWTICYKIIYNNVRSILIYKGGPSYPNEKYKEIVVHIPVPSINKVAWGVYENQYIQDIGHLDKKLKSFESISIVFEGFLTMEDYIIDSISKAINYTLKSGFTVSGRIVKIF